MSSSPNEIDSSLYSCSHLFPDCFFNGDKECKNWKRISALTTSCVGLLGRLYLKSRSENSFQVFHRVKVYNEHVLYEVLDNNAAVITVANHYSCGDEPLLWGATLSVRRLCDNHRMRWALAAHDICFTKPLHSHFFAFGKSIPVVRGAGVHQNALKFALDRLHEGQWVHVYPEGRVNTTKEDLRLKWGVGRLIMETETVTPIVVPIYHVGMDDIWPSQKPYVPSFRPRELTVNIGRPIDLGPLVKRLKGDKGLSDDDRRKAITDVIQQRLRELKINTIILHIHNQASYVY